MMQMLISLLIVALTNLFLLAGSAFTTYLVWGDKRTAISLLILGLTVNAMLLVLNLVALQWKKSLYLLFAAEILAAFLLLNVSDESVFVVWLCAVNFVLVLRLNRSVSED